VSLSVNFSQHNIYAAENDDNIAYELSQADVFEHGQVDEARWSHAVAVGIWGSIAD
jgi:hypothetical protein